MIPFDKKLRATFLANYLKQCKIFHQIAFFQWRNQFAPTAQSEQLIDCFETQSGFA
jgi:hypothetical protein